MHPHMQIIPQISTNRIIKFILILKHNNMIHIATQILIIEQSPWSMTRTIEYTLLIQAYYIFFTIEFSLNKFDSTKNGFNS